MQTLGIKSFRFLDFELDGVKRLLLKSGEPVALNSKAFDLLIALVERRGEVLTKDELLNKVWPGQFVEEGNLKVHVAALRRAFGESKDEHRFIVTVPGRGYSFVAELENDACDEIMVESHRYRNIVVEDADSAFENEPYISPEHRQPSSQKSAFPKHRKLFISFVALVVGALGFAYWLNLPASSRSSPIRSVAVMPFTNETGNADLEYLSDGMTESLINSLSKIPKLSVKARSSVFRYKGKEVLPREVGSDLNVQAVLSGRVIGRGDQLILYLSLVDTQTGDQIWGDQYNRSIADLASLQNQIAREVTRKLETKLSGADEQRLSKNYTESAEAFQLYLKGRYFWNKFTAVDHLKAIEFFNQSIAADPGYALAYVGLGDTYGASAVNSWISPKEGYLKAKAAVKKALEIDHTLAHAHATMGGLYMFSDSNWTSAEQEYKLAIELDPNDEITHELYSYLLTALGGPDEAIKEAQRALELDPLSATLSDDLALAYFFARRYDEAMQQNLKTLELEPDRPDTIYRMGTIYELKGMYDKAIVTYEKAIGLSERTSNFLGGLGHAYAASGKRNDAEKILNELKTASKRTYVSPYDLAMIYIGLGANDRALEQLKRAYEERSGWIINLQVDPFLDPLRGDRGFRDFMRISGF